MLRIGEFSVLTQISIYMLRHYNEIGLLMPEYVDQFTGYRYYSEEQLPVAGKIRALKNMGLSLALIKDILTKYTSENELKSYLENQAIQQKVKIELLQRQLTLIESTIEHLDCQSSIPEYSIALKDFPKHDVVSYRQTIAAPNRESVLWWGLANAVQSLNIQYSSPNLNIAIFHDEGFVEENLDVEIQKSVARKYPDTGIAKFKTIEPFTAATLTYKGHYVKLPEVYEAMARWIADNHYKIAGPHFNIYHVSPETQEAFEDMITEVCFPVEPV